MMNRNRGSRLRDGKIVVSFRPAPATGPKKVILVEDDMETIGPVRMLLTALLFVLFGYAAVGYAQEIGKPANIFYQAYVVAPSYEYELSGRKDRVKGYVVRLDAPAQLTSPGLVILVSGIAP